MNEDILSNMFGCDTYCILDSPSNRYCLIGPIECNEKLIEVFEKGITVKLKYTESSFEYTVLMDEPDRNLDIDNVMQIYNVLSFHKPQTQIIAIVHNPALIYKLSKLDCVNFIEMTEGYLNKISIFASN